MLEKRTLFNLWWLKKKQKNIGENIVIIDLSTDSMIRSQSSHSHGRVQQSK